MTPTPPSAINPQEVARRLLTRERAQARVAHAYLFYGSGAEERRELARWWAAALFGQDSRWHDTAHPDLLWIAPSKAHITKDQVVPAVDFIAHRPAQAQRRVVVIDGADRLLHESGNLLLKTLEEPPQGAVFLLLAEGIDTLLPTIVSRCRALRLPARTAPQLMAALAAEGVPHAQAGTAAALADGSLDRARRIVSDEVWQAAVEGVASALPGLGPSQPTGAALHPAAQAVWAEHAKAWRDDGVPVTAWLSLAVRDGLAHLLGRQTAWLAAEQADRLAAGLGWHGLVRAVMFLREADLALAANVNAVLSFEVLAARLAALAQPAPTARRAV